MILKVIDNQYGQHIVGCFIHSLATPLYLYTRLVLWRFISSFLTLTLT